ncbi:hypothetical protein QJS10_CPA10g01502 [Acorus calamus]|uniref:Uncharacterized protein n=1 Tax=Acorus calamus TaxID=4465 RepID=A0AAV9E2P6_ACOCL|nr:hypothetical protein QJS10_CPA10g01502 [Acorus calamus]
MSCGLPIEDDMGVKMMMNLYPKHVHGIELWLEKEEIMQMGHCARPYNGDDSYPSLVRDPYQPSSSSFVPNTQEGIFGTTPTNVHESAHGRPFYGRGKDYMLNGQHYMKKTLCSLIDLLELGGRYFKDLMKTHVF